MRILLCLSVLGAAVPGVISAADNPPVKFEQAIKEAATVPACAKLLQSEIHGVYALMLTVKDKASLEAMSTAVMKSSGRVGEIAARLKTLPAPASAERAKIAAEMEAADAASQKAMQPKLKAHMDSMTPELRSGLQATLKAFFAKLDGYSGTFSQYFRPDGAGPDRK